MLRFHIPLIEPDMRCQRIRLSVGGLPQPRESRMPQNVWDERSNAGILQRLSMLFLRSVSREVPLLRSAGEYPTVSRRALRLVPRLQQRVDGWCHGQDAAGRLRLAPLLRGSGRSHPLR
jgi:hypothetical protein